MSFHSFCCGVPDFMSSCMMSHGGPHAVCTIVLTNCFKKRAKIIVPIFCHRGTIMESSRIDSHTDVNNI